MARYKLTYFSFKGRGELARYLFAYAGVAYDDVRIDLAKWPQEKKKYPLKQLPVLQINNGPMMSHSIAISRFLAAEFGLYGLTNEDRLMIDVIVNTVHELHNKMQTTHYEKDKPKRADGKKLLREVTIPFYLKRLNVDLESNRENGGYYVGSKISLADLYYFNLLYDLIPTYHKDLDLDQYHKANKLIEKVKASQGIAEWIQKRPKSN